MTKPGAIVAAVAALLLAPAAASGSVRLASPAGAPNPTCNPVACDLETAVEEASPGDEVVVGPGAYALASQIDVSSPIFVHGAGGQPVPLLISTASSALAVTSPGALVRRFELVHFGGADALVVAAGVVERAVVRGSSAQFACQVHGAGLRDSVCWSVGAGGRAVGLTAVGTSEYTSLRNVTAVASGAGSRGLDVQAYFGGVANLVGFNLIADGAGADIEADTDGASIANIELHHSNFTTRSLVGAYSYAPVPGSGSNQAARPAFTDSAAGDFHQRVESPTIDWGTTNAGVSDEDVDGDPRVQGFQVDIGADEFVPSAPPADVNPPDTKILKRPGRKTKSRTARFKFGTSEPAGATLMCKLDGEAYAHCDSPLKIRVKRRRHTFRVFSIDAAGNVDPTPDAASWRVKRKQGRAGHGGKGGGGKGGGGHK